MHIFCLPSLPSFNKRYQHLAQESTSNIPLYSYHSSVKKLITFILLLFTFTYLQVAIIYCQVLPVTRGDAPQARDLVTQHSVMVTVHLTSVNLNDKSSVSPLELPSQALPNTPHPAPACPCNGVHYYYHWCCALHDLLRLGSFLHEWVSIHWPQQAV